MHRDFLKNLITLCQRTLNSFCRREVRQVRIKQSCPKLLSQLLHQMRPHYRAGRLIEVLTGGGEPSLLLLNRGYLSRGIGTTQCGFVNAQAPVFSLSRRLLPQHRDRACNAFLSQSVKPKH